VKKANVLNHVNNALTVIGIGILLLYTYTSCL